VILRPKYEFNNKMNLKEEYVDWLNLTHEICLYWVFVNTLIKLWVPIKE
jgi:hypothetical protein